jgi:hypothetical protein
MTDITSFSPLTDQWSDPIYVDGAPYYVENADVNGNAPWAITQTGAQSLRFQLNPGDTWADNGSHRTEIAGGTIYAPTTTVNTSYQFMVEPGATNQYWTVLGQFHSDDKSAITQSLTADYPVFAVELTGKNGSGQGDYLGIWADYALPGQTTPTAITATGTSSFGFAYVSPTPIVRGQYYSVQVEASFQNNANGFLEVWVNGAEVVDYHGPLGYGAGNYWKEGIYQDSANTTQSIAVDYQNLSISTGKPAPAPSPEPTPTPTPAVTTMQTPTFTDIVHNADGSATLSGQSEADSTVTIYGNHSHVLGTATADASGNWTFTTGSLANIEHYFSLSATDAAGNSNNDFSSVGLYGTTHHDAFGGSAGFVMSGGPGADTFYFAPRFGANIITDFQARGAGHDVITFDSAIFQNFAQVLSHASQVGSDVVITGLNAANTITLLDVHKHSLQASDFHFV